MEQDDAINKTVGDVKFIYPDWTPEVIKAHNMRTLNLTEDQYFLWCLVEKSSINTWPESLKALCKSISDRIGWCGDLQAETVAKWIREKQA